MRIRPIVRSIDLHISSNRVPMFNAEGSGDNKHIFFFVVVVTNSSRINFPSICKWWWSWSWSWLWSDDNAHAHQTTTTRLIYIPIFNYLYNLYRISLSRPIKYNIEQKRYALALSLMRSPQTQSGVIPPPHHLDLDDCSSFLMWIMVTLYETHTHIYVSIERKRAVRRMTTIRV